MTDWTCDRIPIWVPPVPGEALDSWLEAYARRLLVTAHALTGFVGLPGSRPGAMTHRLTDQERDTLQRTTGLSQATLVSMTLEPFNGLTVVFDKNRPGYLRRPPHWRVSGAHPRFCPRCLHEAEGRWPLAWRQPWTFACPRHQCMLLEQCPACHQPARAGGTRVGGPTLPSACTRGKHHHHGKHRDRVACGYPLNQASTAPLPANGMILAAQHRVDRVLAQISTNPKAASQSLADLYTLGSRALRSFELDPAGAPQAVRRIVAEAGGAPPAQTNSHEAIDVRSVAIGTTIARQALFDPEPLDPELLDWVVDTSHQRSIQGQGSAPKAAFYIAKVWSKSSPHLAGTALTRLDPSDMALLTRLRYGTAGPTPYWRQLSSEEMTLRASRVPAQLWPSWALRLLPAGSGIATTAEVLRAAACPLLLVPGTNLGYQGAGSMLTEPGLSRRSTRLKLPPNADHQQIASALTQLAWALDRFGSPIDYARRRRTFQADSIHLDQAALTEVCARHDLRLRYYRRDALLSWTVWSALLGSDAPTRRDHAAERHYRRHLPTCLKDFVRQQVQAHLHAAGIDEPFQWEPPADWVTGVVWPGIDPAGISRSRVSELAAQAPVERELASSLGMTQDQLELYCETFDVDYPAPATRAKPYTPREPAPDSDGGRRVPRTGDLAPDRLRQLHHEEGESLTQIAARARCSRSTVSQAFRDFDIPTRHYRRPPGTLEQIVSRTWLEDECIRKGRSSPDIARELGLPKSAILSLMHKWDIPRHPEWHSNVFAALPAELSPAMTMLSRTRNILPRLRNLIALPGHQSLQAAANSLGVARGALDGQIQRIEAATGITVIDRSHPLSATASGRPLIAEAQRLLKLLDEHTQ